MRPVKTRAISDAIDREIRVGLRELRDAGEIGDRAFRNIVLLIDSAPMRYWRYAAIQRMRAQAVEAGQHYRHGLNPEDLDELAYWMLKGLLRREVVVMTPEDFLSRLERVRPTGDAAWVAACPAHDDRVASLGVAMGREDRILVTCRAGCTTLDIVDVLGLRLTDLFADDMAPSRAVPVRSRPGFVTVPAVPVKRGPVLPRARVVPPSVTEGDVTRWMARLSGHTALLSRLYELKGWSPANMRSAGLGFDGRRVTFPVRAASLRAPGSQLTGVLRYLPRGERKMLAGRGVPRDLWPAPETLPEGTIVLVEGEPDAVSGMELGLPTVALPGAGGWKDSWAARFVGRDVVMVADCDGPGRDVAERVRACLSGVATVRVVDLDPGRSDGHDLGDEVRAASRFGELGLLGLRRRVLELAGAGSVPSRNAVTRRAA